MANHTLQNIEQMMVRRKRDHIDLAFESQISAIKRDARFRYEPVLRNHPETWKEPITFLGKQLSVPVWISSMTGGTGYARKINSNLARVCNEFGMGMGLGSCRSLLHDDTHLKDFNVRELLGDSLPLFANLGISQVEKLVQKKEYARIHDLIVRLKADGLIIHVNPLQEWMQPEGDRILVPPIDTIENFLSETSYPLVVKEVGQGMGPESLRALLKLPLAALEFGAFGGTNFSKVELSRDSDVRSEILHPFANVGEDAESMIDSVNQISEKEILCKQFIISGGVKNFLDGHYFTSKLKFPSIYGQASSFLKYALDDYDMLQKFVRIQVEGLALARSFLKVI